MRTTIQQATGLFVFMGFKERIKNMDEHKLALLVLCAVGIFVFLCLTPFFFFNNPGVPLGWLLGTAIEIFNFWSIIFSSSMILATAEGKKVKGVAFSTIFVFLRLALWAGGLALGGLCTYKWNNNWLNVWSVFAAYVPMTIAVAITFLSHGKAKVDATFNPKKEEEEKHE